MGTPDVTIRATLAACATALLTALSISAAHAVTVAPMQVEMTSSGARSHATVSVINNSKEPLPIEAAIKSMTLDEAGRASTAEAGDEFLVMPPQTIIPPGATQNFRIQWLGEPMLTASRSYYIFFNQVPVKQKAGTAAVQVVMSVGTLVNVAPPQGAASLRVLETGVTPPDKSGKRHPTITLQNPGNVHALVSSATVRVSGGGWSEVLPPGLLSEKLGSGLVQPGKKRKFSLPVDLPPNVTNVQATIELGPRRP